MENKQIDKLDNIGECSNQTGSITTSEFLDFLKLTCRVHESVILKDDNGKPLDYNALAKNELVNALVNLKSGQSPKSNGPEESCSDKNGECYRKSNGEQAKWLKSRIVQKTFKIVQNLFAYF